MDRSFIDQNEVSRERLRSLVDSLTKQDLDKQLGEHWTVGVGLAHLAFWDRQWLTKLQEWEHTGIVSIPPVSQQRDLLSALNDGMLPWWREVSSDFIRLEVIAAAEAMDARVAKLPDFLVEAIMVARPGTLFRGGHRGQHLGEIESTLGKM